VHFDEVATLLHGVPYIRPREARALYEFVLEGDVNEILELGFAHGASTSYMAAALDERKSGRITTMDLHGARARWPNLEEIVEKTGLGSYIEAVYCDTYTWELMKLIERQTRGSICEPMFDFCYVDGAHTWDTDGFAFFLVEKLLRPGGWLLFDDLHWSVSSDPSLMAMPHFAAMPEEHRRTCQIGKVFGLLVCQHPGFESVRVDDNWGWARKKPGENSHASVQPDILEKVYGSTIRRDAELLALRIAQKALRRF
jgi:predicted O-methyltransferase YrrM